MDDLSELLCEVTPSDEQKWVKMGNIDFQNSCREDFVKIASVWRVFSTKFVIKRILGKNLLNSATRISGADGNETKIVSLKRLFRKLIFGNKIGLTEWVVEVNGLTSIKLDLSIGLQPEFIDKQLKLSHRLQIKI